MIVSLRLEHLAGTCLWPCPVSKIRLLTRQSFEYRKGCKLKVLAAVVLLGFVEASIARAADFDGLDLRPLLSFHESKSTTIGVGPVNGTIEEEHNLFISRGGATTLNIVSRSNQEEWRTQLFRGVGTSEQLASLNQALSDSKIGRLKSCAKLVAEGLQVKYDITWFGWNDKGKRSLSVIYGHQPSTGVPTCPADVDRLIQGIGVYERDFTVNPDTSMDR